MTRLIFDLHDIARESSRHDELSIRAPHIRPATNGAGVITNRWVTIPAPGSDESVEVEPGVAEIKIGSELNASVLTVTLPDQDEVYLKDLLNQDAAIEPTEVDRIWNAIHGTGKNIEELDVPDIREQINKIREDFDAFEKRTDISEMRDQLGEVERRFDSFEESMDLSEIDQQIGQLAERFGELEKRTDIEDMREQLESTERRIDEIVPTTGWTWDDLDEKIRADFAALSEKITTTGGAGGGSVSASDITFFKPPAGYGDDVSITEGQAMVDFFAEHGIVVTDDNKIQASVAAMFLHSETDNPVVSLAWWLAEVALTAEEMLRANESGGGFLNASSDKMWG